MKKTTIEEELAFFAGLWDANRLCDFLRDIIPLFELYNVDDDKDWVLDEVGSENVRNVRMIRMIYIVSKIAENHAGVLAKIRSHHKDLYKRLEKEADKQKGLSPETESHCSNVRF